MDDEEIIDRLVQVRGVGRWTVEMLLMFRLGRPDVLPAGDSVACKGFMLTYGTSDLPAPKLLLEHGERWPVRFAPWQAGICRAPWNSRDKPATSSRGGRIPESQAIICWTTSPATSVRRKSRPWKR